MQKTAVFGCLGALLLAGIIAFFVGVGGYNSLVGLRNNVDVKWADVENQYQRRADLVGNLVNTVKGAANFEQKTLTDVISARANATRPEIKLDSNHAPEDPAQLEKFQQAQSQLSGALGRLLAVSERYPELKATGNFRDLQAQLEGTENRIAVARHDFNDSTLGYNNKRQGFPTVLIAGMLGFREKPPFKAREGSDVPPTVDFGGGSPAPGR